MSKGSDDLQRILGELEGAAKRLGIAVSYETLAASVSGGGLCRVNGSYRVIIDKRSTVGERVATLARALWGVHPTPSEELKRLPDSAPLSPETEAVVRRYQNTK